MTEQNIYQRINEVRKKVSYVQKDKLVQGYKAVTHDAVTAMIRNELIENGVIIIPSLIDSSIVDVGVTQGGTQIIRYQGRYNVIFVNADDPQDTFFVTVESHANDHGDKAPGKATSYAVKIAMLKVFTIETGEDEESRVEAYGTPREPITQEKSLDIQAQLEELGADKTQFLAYLSKLAKRQIESLDDIPAKMIKDVELLIAAKRKQIKKGAGE